MTQVFIHWGLMAVLVMAPLQVSVRNRALDFLSVEQWH